MQNLWAWVAAHLTLWTFVGLFGQSMFMMRFVLQWIASERAKQSVMPEVFWYFSLGGGLIVFVYAVHQQDLVFMLGQGLGIFIYLRNIYFIIKRRRAAAGGTADA
ncbi:MAG: lipid-A-disaccharide synthase N-terminal domain-containing protein [Alphaproteobacteria bacterium]|nr:lipid-A-disaccharide synthase N-terminal domain-containing protein [Alphaproteobacteria bacterium]